MTKNKKRVFETAFNSYTTIDKIGEGGSGIVFKAKDSNDDTVAIKLLKTTNLPTNKLRRFKNEMSFCSNFKHKNIISVIDEGFTASESGKIPFFVMPYYENTLRKVMLNGVEADLVLPVFSDILDGIEASHLHNIWHRDLKPENILTSADLKKIVVADFGIAHFSEEILYTAVETHNHERLANFQYSAPEQKERDGRVDHRCDIYALGLILNELFTGCIPQGTNYKKIKDTISEYGYLDELVESMINQSLENRPHTVDNIKKELIGRRKEFINLQKIDRLKNTVIPESEITDPIYLDPVRIVDVDYENEQLVFHLNHVVSSEWIDSFKNIGDYSCFPGKEPTNFEFLKNMAIVPSTEQQARQLAGFTKDYISKANMEYRKRIEAFRRRQQEEKKRKLIEEIEERKKRDRIIKSINF